MGVADETGLEILDQRGEPFYPPVEESEPSLDSGLHHQEEVLME